MSETDNDQDGREPIEFGAEIDALLADPSMWEQPPSDLGDRVAASIQAEASQAVPAVPQATGMARRGWLRPALLGAAAAVAILLGGVVALSALSGVEDRDTFSAELTSTGLINDVEGSVEIASFDSGLRIDLDAPSLPRRANGKFYEGWLRTVDGDLIPVGTFHGGDSVTMWAGVGLDEVEAFTITLEESVAGDDIGQGSSGDVVLRAAVGG